MSFAEIGTAAVLVLALVAVYGVTRRPHSNFRPTDQVVRDEMGRRLRLYVDPRTGEQQYREETGPPE